MPLVAAKCTNCGGILEIDNEKDAAICRYCDTPFVVEKAINNYVVNNSIQAENVYIQSTEKEFDISGGVLAKYLGNKTDVEIPQGVYEIADNCFMGTYIKRIVFPKELKKIGNFAFANCENLEEIIFNECEISHVGEKAFSGCNKLKRFNFNNLSSIGERAFEKTAIEDVVLSSDIKFIGEGIFKDCNNLKTAKIDGLLNTLDINLRRLLFDGCSLLLDIQCEFCDDILAIYKEHGKVYLNDHDELLCDSILGSCAFTKFFARGGEYSKIQPKGIKCLFCGGKMTTVKDGLFKSHRECSECGRVIPDYEEFENWISAQDRSC